MSLAEQRDEFAAVLSTVAGVQGHAFRPVPPTEGDAWPLVASGVRDAVTAYMINWRIIVFMPQDEVAASTWWDLRWPDLFNALERVATVGNWRPVVLSAGGLPGGQLAFEIDVQTGE